MEIQPEDSKKPALGLLVEKSQEALQFVYQSSPAGMGDAQTLAALIPLKVGVQVERKVT